MNQSSSVTVEFLTMDEALEEFDAELQRLEDDKRELDDRFATGVMFLNLA